MKSMPPVFQMKLSQVTFFVFVLKILPINKSCIDKNQKNCKKTHTEITSLVGSKLIILVIIKTIAFPKQFFFKESSPHNHG